MYIYINLQGLFSADLLQTNFETPSRSITKVLPAKLITFIAPHKTYPVCGVVFGSGMRTLGKVTATSLTFFPVRQGDFLGPAWRFRFSDQRANIDLLAAQIERACTLAENIWLFIKYILGNYL